MSTHAWRNWRAFQEGHPRSEGWESPLYGDTELNGKLTTGPYRFMRSHTWPDTGPSMQAVLRIDFHPWPELVAERQTVQLDTRETDYHGGSLDDELTALVSLATGARLRSGGRNRVWFIDGEDPLGTPIEFDHHPPHLGVGTSRGLLLPHVREPRSLSAAERLLQKFASIESEESVVALVRAARMFSQAIWVADDDPNLAWILLIGAVEAAASQFDAQPSLSAVDKLKIADSDLAKMLERHGGSALLEEYARTRGGHHRIKRRFLSLIDQYGPAPPAKRAASWAIVDWEGLDQHAAKIYDYRSRYLHAGHPFPYPMFEAPHRDHELGAWAERPAGLATSARGSTWNADDVPMLLWVFEYIAREVLCAWWSTLA